MHRFLPDLIFLIAVEVILFSAVIDILAMIPYKPIYLSGVLVILLLIIISIMVIIYRAISSLWKHIYKRKGS